MTATEKEAVMHVYALQATALNHLKSELPKLIKAAQQSKDPTDITLGIQYAIQDWALAIAVMLSTRQGMTHQEAAEHITGRLTELRNPL